jgi:hypothetical protein
LARSTLDHKRAEFLKKDHKRAEFLKKSKEFKVRKSPSPSVIENLVKHLLARDLKRCRFESLRKSRAKFLRAGDPGNVRCAVAGRAGAVGTQAKRVFEEPLQDRLVTSPPA